MRNAPFCLILIGILLISTIDGFKKGEKGISKKDAEKDKLSFKRPEIKVEIVKRPEECERKSKNGDTISVHYVGMLENGVKFDSSRDRDEAFSFSLGTGQVIKGWEQGMSGACVGEQRKLWIPYQLAYGDRGMPPTIPARSNLVFQVEIIGIK